MSCDKKRTDLFETLSLLDDFFDHCIRIGGPLRARTPESVQSGRFQRQGTSSRTVLPERAICPRSPDTFLYFTGKGVVQDYGEAFKWMSRAAEQGYAQAQINLGDL